MSFDDENLDRQLNAGISDIRQAFTTLPIPSAPFADERSHRPVLLIAAAAALVVLGGIAALTLPSASTNIQIEAASPGEDSQQAETGEPADSAAAPSTAPEGDAAASVDPTATPAAAECQGEVRVNLAEAMSSYSELCGQTFSENNDLQGCVEEGAGWRCSGPVSYTHLTLPTICSV